MDKILAMRAFTTVVSEGSFVKAADKMELSPQLVSKYVAQLEDSLKIRLLNRTTRRVNLTEAGQTYFDRCHQVLVDIDDMESALTNLQTQVSGTLRVSAPMSFGVYHLSAPIAQFQSDYPDVKVELFLTDRKVDILEEGVDIALRIGHLKDSALIAKKIAPVNLSVCASPNYWKTHGKPEDFDSLCKLNYLKFAYSDPRSLFVNWPKHMNIHDLNSDFSSNNGDVIVKSAILERGYAIQPTFLTGADIAQGRLEIADAFLVEPLGLYALYSHREFLASKVRHFIDFLAQYYGDTPYWDRY